MTQRLTARRRITRLGDGAAAWSFDELAAEEPMEIRVDGQTVAVTMRTPGHDFDLAIGFCLTEGILDSPDEVGAARYCPDPDQPQTYNLVDVQRRTPGPVDDRLKRNVYTSSSCGLCGTASIEAVRKRTAAVGDDAVTVSAAVVSSLPDRLRESQRIFSRTGGLHAAGLYTAQGDQVCVREDVGRHNALDKVIGWAAREGRLPLEGHVLMVSGRVAFEIVQKALIARIPVVAAVSAPSSLAADLAESAGMTLLGFVRGSAMNVYCGGHRVTQQQ